MFSANPHLSGRGSYLVSVAANGLFGRIGRHWTVWLDEERLEDDFALVSMCNGRYYGGGSTPVPEARMNDGVLHTVLVKNISKLRFARLFPDYSAGNHEKLPKDVVRFSTAKVVRIHSDDGDIVTCLDGECSHSHDVTPVWQTKSSISSALPVATRTRRRAERILPNCEFLQIDRIFHKIPLQYRLPCAMIAPLVSTRP